MYGDSESFSPPGGDFRGKGIARGPAVSKGAEVIKFQSVVLQYLAIERRDAGKQGSSVSLYGRQNRVDVRFGQNDDPVPEVKS